jgi:hypothetical protein
VLGVFRAGGEGAEKQGGEGGAEGRHRGRNVERGGAKGEWAVAILIGGWNWVSAPPGP